jgi:transposase InsO family protein
VTRPHHTPEPLAELAAASRIDPWAHRQQPRRQRERDVRQRAVMLCDELNPAGFSCLRIARRIGVSRRTLSLWRCRRQRNELDARLRGRPPKQSSFCDRHEVLEVFHEVGPHVGLPTLRAAFPAMPPSELMDLQATYREHYRATHRRSMERLYWTTPGRVWAMDHTYPPSPIDGCFPRVLAVRDLASGMQLAWLPVPDETAETTAAVLQLLFAWHGAPLVLKSDNGSPFISHLFYELLERWKVVPLFSPPKRPQYNGSCEASNGAMKQRTNSLAARGGRIVHWTSDDLKAARWQANEFHRPWGHRGPTRSEVWDSRLSITADERAAFAATLARCQEQARDSVAGALAHGNSTQPASFAAGDAHHPGALARGNSQTVDACVHEEQANRQSVCPDAVRLGAVPGAAIHGASIRARIHRRAVRQALVELGLLSTTRRSIPLPIKIFRSANIM